MPAFLLQLELPELTEEISGVIPAHKAHINKLFSEGKLLSYSVSESRDYIWCVVNAEDQNHAMQIVAGFPLQRFYKDAECFPLLLHNHLPLSLVSSSMN